MTLPDETSQTKPRLKYTFHVIALTVVAATLTLICLFPFYAGVAIAGFVFLGYFISGFMGEQPKTTHTTTIRFKE